MPKTTTPHESIEETSDATALPRYLQLRGSKYTFRRKIPVVHAKAFLPLKWYVTKSLETSDLLQAEKALAREIQEFERIVAISKQSSSAKRQKINAAKHRPDGTTKYLVDAHIPVLLDGYEHALLSMDDEERKLLSRDERAQRLQEFEEGLEHLYDDDSANNYQAWEEIAQDMLTGEGLIAPPNSSVRNELLRQLMKKDIEVLEAQCARLKGRGKLTPQQPSSAKSLPTMREIFLAWIKKQTRTRTINTYETCVAEFEAIHGAMPLISIEPWHVRQYRDWLLETKVMRGTAENRIGGLATLFSFGKIEIVDKATQNPFSLIDLSMFPTTRPSDERRAYAASELNLLFRSKLYTSNFRPEGQTKEALYWAPLLGLFVGGRIEEIAQLRIDDVELLNGVWSIRITESDPEQKVKNDGSTRRVPIHNELIRCGFLAYVAEQKLSGHNRVFPSLKNENENHIWSNALTKRYGSYLDEIGLTDPRLTYHSFRYNFRQQSSICGIENEVRDALTGHWLFEGDAGKTYMKGENRQYPFPVLVDAIRKFRYDELSLSHLYVEDPWKDVQRVLTI